MVINKKQLTQRPLTPRLCLPVTLYSLLSSANSLYGDEDVLPKVLIKIKKRISPVTDPCGTPLVTSTVSNMLAADSYILYSLMESFLLCVH